KSSGDVENAARQTVVPVGKFRRIHFDGFSLFREGHFEFLRRRRVLCLFDVRIFAAHCASLPQILRTKRLRSFCRRPPLAKPCSWSFPPNSWLPDAVRQCARAPVCNLFPQLPRATPQLSVRSQRALRAKAPQRERPKALSPSRENRVSLVARFDDLPLLEILLRKFN